MRVCAISPGSHLLTNNIKFEVDETQVKLILDMYVSCV